MGYQYTEEVLIDGQVDGDETTGSATLAFCKHLIPQLLLLMSLFTASESGQTSTQTVTTESKIDPAFTVTIYDAAGILKVHLLYFVQLIS